MEIISHRGYWLDTEEKNTETAFRRSFAAGFGTETDVRDCAGRLVISHDPPMGQEMSLESFLSIHAEYGGRLPLALNIKSDGLQDALQRVLERFSVGNYFVFDMSVPDSLVYARRGINFYARLSEYEPVPALLEKSQGVWLDAFSGEWFTDETISQYLDVTRGVCVVSSELHGREPYSLWRRLLPLRYDPRVMICTDLPEEAADFFAESTE